MSEQRNTTKDRLNKLLAEAADLTNNETTYINNVTFHIGVNEVTFDMYLVTADPRTLGKNTQAERLQRIVMPVGVAKELALLLINGISQWEDTFGITLPISPQSLSDEEAAHEKESLDE
ncbi:MAG: DUF3467 domain-containing protein [Chloroflexi bacterium]|nr:DUF3467 domain-containing protein [Chloroflexota bacterium]MDL1883111.1 DUF3467 domain-containing protein [Anaerolineae bacterium CFX8]